MNILLLQGTGNSEEAMVRVCSRFGRAVLIQGGMCRHVEVWEDGRRVENSDFRLIRFARWQDVLLGLPNMFLGLRLALRNRAGRRYDVIVATVYDNANTALVLRWLGVAKRVIALACDYLPAAKVPWHIRCHRRITSWLTANNLRWADAVWLVSPRIPNRGRTDAAVMPLFINEFPSAPQRKRAIAYVGVPTPEHGLEMLFEIAERQGIEVHVFGDSPYLQSLPRKTNLIQLHGVITDRRRLHDLIKDCYCGFAIYKGVHRDSFLYYGVWSKIYTYLGSKLPVVTTAGSYTSDVVQENNLGKIVAPETDAIEQAVLRLWDEREDYRARLDTFVPRWNRRAEDFLAAQIGGMSVPEEKSGSISA